MTGAVPVAKFNYPTTYRLGCGRLRELPSACEELGLHRPLLVTDAFIAARPWFGALLESFSASKATPGTYAEVQANPSDDDVVRGVEQYRRDGHDGVVLIGGGSPMDVGKCIALLAHHETDVFDFEDVGDNYLRADPSKIPPIIAVPTTAGTGSEVGRASVILDPRDRNKKIIFHPKMMPSLVIADPELTYDLPAALTAATGMDALAHCFEALCAPFYHPMADGIALEGLRLIHQHLRRAVSHGRDPAARTHMMMAASMGATAFQKGLGLVHALSHPLGGMTKIHHGTANSIFLPYVMAFNREVIEAPMRRLALALDLPSPGFDAVMRWVLDLRHDLALPHTIAEAGIDFDAAMAKRIAVMALGDPSMGGNPKPATESDCELLLRRAWSGDLDLQA